MRLFVAIRFNDEILDALEELQVDLHQSGLRGNYTRQRQVFWIGEVMGQIEV